MCVLFALVVLSNVNSETQICQSVIWHWFYCLSVQLCSFCPLIYRIVSAVDTIFWFPGCFLCWILWYHRRDWLINMLLVLLLCQQSSMFAYLKLCGTFHHLWIFCFGKSVSPPSSFVHPTFGLPPPPLFCLLPHKWILCLLLNELDNSRTSPSLSQHEHTPSLDTNPDQE